MMTRNQWLMCKLAEEAAEVSQRAMKAQQFGLGEVQPGQNLNNAERLCLEMHDIISTWALFCEEFDTGMSVYPGVGYDQRRREKMAKFLELSQSEKQVQ